jgi:hypothetical protein
MPGLVAEIARRCDRAKRFVVLPTHPHVTAIIMGAAHVVTVRMVARKSAEDEGSHGRPPGAG